jgi:hypothetical protein
VKQSRGPMDKNRIMRPTRPDERKLPCGTLRPACVGGGECRVFEHPEYAVLGKTRYDQNWIDSNTEAGVAACGGSVPSRGRKCWADRRGEAPRTREKEAAGPDRPHQASRCANANAQSPTPATIPTPEPSPVPAPPATTHDPVDELLDLSDAPPAKPPRRPCWWWRPAVAQVKT